jgi:hypothetical protein
MPFDSSDSFDFARSASPNRSSQRAPAARAAAGESRRSVPS